MGNTSNNGIIEPYLHSCDSIITEVNQEFIDFTGFTRDELLGKSLIEIGDILKLNSQILLNNIDSKSSAYIFTKLLEAREVIISLFNSNETNEKVYTFVEKPKSRLNDKLIFEEHKFTDNISGVAVYSVPDLILLRTNQRYLEFMDFPLNNEENSIGRPIREIVTGFVGSQVEVVWDSILETQKTCNIKKMKFENFERGISYWNFTQTPIFENGKMKYIFETSIEVIEGVFDNQSLERQNKEIQQQKEQLASIIENFSEGIMIADYNGKIIMVNPEAKRLVYQSDKLTDLGAASKNTKYLDMKGKEILFENLPSIRALRGDRVKNVKMFINHRSEEHFIEVSSTPIYNTNGDLTVVVTCFHDITETIEQSRKIEKQKEELEAIIENISAGISIFDNSGQCILINKSEREMFFPYYEHKTRNEQSGYLCDINGKKVSLENNPIQRVIRGEKFKNMRMVVKYPLKTLQIDVSGTPIYDSEGKFTSGVICNRDMTDYFKHEEDIKNRCEFLDRMIDTFDLPVARLSCLDLKIVDINKKAFSIIKLFRPNIKSMDEIIHYNIEDLFKTYKVTEYYQCINEVLKEKKIVYLNKQKHLVNGNEIYWNVIFEPVFGVYGDLQEIIILLIDVTTEIKANIVMEKALKFQEEFLANISHELKTPLNVICATVQLFNMYCNSGSLYKKKNSIIKYIDSIKQNTYRLSKLINNIVDLSKIEAGYFELNLSNNNIVEV
ncbi:MAG: PAS domain S-box protein, partial [Clostridiaceae bacterium]|nr:PAS domain S-box protein [Clostridiaceae bacterium]